MVFSDKIGKKMFFGKLDLYEMVEKVNCNMKIFNKVSNVGVIVVKFKIIVLLFFNSCG